MTLAFVLPLVLLFVCLQPCSSAAPRSTGRSAELTFGHGLLRVHVDHSLSRGLAHQAARAFCDTWAAAPVASSRRNRFRCVSAETNDEEISTGAGGVRELYSDFVSVQLLLKEHQTDDRAWLRETENNTGAVVMSELLASDATRALVGAMLAAGSVTLQVRAIVRDAVVVGREKRRDRPSGRPHQRQLFGASYREGAARNVAPVDALGLDALRSAFPDANGRGIRVGILDTGLSPNNPHFEFADVAACMSFTHDRSLAESSHWCSDGHGHGTFGASLLVGAADRSGRSARVARRGASASCRQHELDGGMPDPERVAVGLAPKAHLYVFKVFTDAQLSLTSWFLRAFDAALQYDLDLINFSFGGMDYYDTMFVEKVRQLAEMGVIVVTATGNEGPRFGSVFNPADQSDVISVGSCDGPSATRVSPFSSRGLSTWELPFGVGRPRPDVLSFGENVVAASGSQSRRSCRVLSGTSVASPVVCGALAAVASHLRSIGVATRATLSNSAAQEPAAVAPPLRLNVALLKQLITEATDVLVPRGDVMRERTWLPSRNDLRDLGAVTQGAGVLNVSRMLHRIDELIRQAHNRELSPNGTSTAALLRRALGRLTAFPSALYSISLTDLLRKSVSRVDFLRFAWPQSLQRLYHGSGPVIFNVTLYNSLSATARLDGQPTTTVRSAQCTQRNGENRGTKEGEYDADWASLLAVTVLASERLASHSGFVSVALHVSSAMPRTCRLARLELDVTIVYRCDAPSNNEALRVVIPVFADVFPPPPREQRLLWDVSLQLQYPNLYIPRDNIRDTSSSSFADWSGDHPHTNLMPLFEYLRYDMNFYIDVVHHPDTLWRKRLSRDAIAVGATTSAALSSDGDEMRRSRGNVSLLGSYGVLLVVDPEDYVSPAVADAIAHAVKVEGVHLAMITDWAHEGVMRVASFTDPATGIFWTPATGGVNVAGINPLLRRFGLEQSDHCVVSGGISSFRRKEAANTATPTEAAERHGTLTSAGCLSYVSAVSEAHDPARQVYRCRSVARLRNDAEELARQFSPRRGSSGEVVVPIDATGAVSFAAFVRYAPVDSVTTLQQRPQRTHRRRIPVAEDSVEARFSAQNPAHGEVTESGNASEGGGGVFVFTDSDCFDSMNHYTVGGRPSGHEYCFSLLGEALRSLRGIRVGTAGSEDTSLSSPTWNQLCTRVGDGVAWEAPVEVRGGGVNQTREWRRRRRRRGSQRPISTANQRKPSAGGGDEWDDDGGSSAEDETAAHADPLFLSSRRYSALRRTPSTKSKSPTAPLGASPRDTMEQFLRALLTPWLRDQLELPHRLLWSNVQERRNQDEDVGIGTEGRWQRASRDVKVGGRPQKMVSAFSSHESLRVLLWFLTAGVLLYFGGGLWLKRRAVALLPNSWRRRRVGRASQQASSIAAGGGGAAGRPCGGCAHGAAVV